MKASEGDKNFLPIEIIINVLKRLPAKSIVRFRCVCKDWKNLFKTPSFIADHIHHSHHENPFLLLHEHNLQQRRLSLRLLNHEMKTVEVLSLPPSIDPFGHVYWEIIGSCNGLLCVVVDPASSRSPCSLWLWNPEIREVREVPQTTNDYWDKCQFGFGYSSVLSDYKIVRFCHKQGRIKKEDAIWGYDIKVEVFSLNTSSWKELESGASQNTEIIFPNYQWQC
ncbi:F-box protein CPR1-like [Prosopis cineraria]|uniref:F-box protein CPR1-like n=1 Tax=Prosopis cineraria TaxID=364024 RepID=UPI00240EE557|nr:F-box protein CPR1-like [Prosopis cineraria]